MRPTCFLKTPYKSEIPAAHETRAKRRSKIQTRFQINALDTPYYNYLIQIAVAPQAGDLRVTDLRQVKSTHEDGRLPAEPQAQLKTDPSRPCRAAPRLT